jgi:hypothetical protein
MEGQLFGLGNRSMRFWKSVTLRISLFSNSPNLNSYNISNLIIGTAEGRAAQCRLLKSEVMELQ